MAKAILAGGGVLWRRLGDELRVAMVHRPKYDDWSLPKGKPLAGEHLVATAYREVVEETGLRVRVGARITTVRYPLHSGELKVVDYWEMRYAGGEFAPNDEVDALAWLPLPAAIDRASNDDARDTLLAFGKMPSAESTILLIRHGRAGKKADWAGEDRARPLDHRGRMQAQQLASALPAFGPDRIAAADRLRCAQTVTPLAQALHLPVESEPTFTEDRYGTAPAATYRRFRELAHGTGTTVVCSQGGVIPDLLRRIGADDDLCVGAAESRKGSVWALGVRTGTVVSADYFPDFRSAGQA
ncbi:MAG: NUDIX hydrolase [Mycobacteriales bacterium]